MKQKKALMFLILICACFTLFFGGCNRNPIVAPEKEEVVYSGPVDVWIYVKLDRSFVRSMSEDDPFLKILIGPFLGTRVYINGSTPEPAKEQSIINLFKKEIHWGGENSFNIKSYTNSEIQFKLIASGKRTGSKNIGFAKIGTKPRQKIIIELNESGSIIK